MEVCAYPHPEQDSNSSIAHLGPHSYEGISHLPASELHLSVPAVGGCEEVAVSDSSRIAMQIASGQIIWPIVPKPKEDFSKFDAGFQQSLPFVDANGALHLDSENANLASREVDASMEKCKVRKRRLVSEDGEPLDGDASNEKQSIARWKDVWVAQLIHIKGRTQAALSGPQKQRVDVWQLIKNEMARTCHGFDKDSEACRKKWRRVYKEYKDDKCLHLAGNASQKCKFYDLMDFYMGERTSGTSNSELTAVGYDVKCLVKDEHATNENGEAMSMGSTMPNATPHALEGPVASERHDAPGESLARLHTPGTGHSAPLSGEVRATKRPYRKVKDQASESGSAGASKSLPSLLSELVGIGKEMLEMTRRYEQGKINVLHLMKETLSEITKEI